MKKILGVLEGLGKNGIYLAVGCVILAAVILLILVIIAARNNKAEKKQEEELQKTTDAKELPSQKTMALKTEVSEEGTTGMKSRYRAGAAQIIGSRANQEDSYCVSPWKDAETVARQGILAAVADGVGGLSNGEVASFTLMQTFSEEFGRLLPGLTSEEKLLQLMAKGQSAVLKVNREGGHCGTTLVTVLIENDYLSLLSVGDSRICLYRAGGLLQLNREHILGRESEEYRALHYVEEADERKRGLVTSFIGKEGLKLIDRTLNPIRLISGDRIVLMSDGVFGTLSDDEMIALLNQAPEDAATAIVEAVKERARPHQDNATVVVIGLD